MKIHYSLDDSAARIPLAIRSTEGVWDRAADLRNSPGVHLVELTTQHMLNTGATLLDEIATYYETGTASETDPYALAHCFAHRTALEDLLNDLRDLHGDLTAFDAVETLFPPSFRGELQLTLAITVVGYPAFGYVRTYKDSEGEEYHGMVINLAHTDPDGDESLSLSVLADTIRHGFFNREAFLLAYSEFLDSTGRTPDRVVAQLKDAVLRRGIAWYLSYAHDFAFYDAHAGLDGENLAGAVDDLTRLIASARSRRGAGESLDEWLRGPDHPNVGEQCIDVVGYHAARAVADQRGPQGLRDSIARGPDHFIRLYNGGAEHPLKG